MSGRSGVVAGQFVADVNESRPGLRLAAHRHAHVCVVVPLAGSWLETTDGWSVACRPGSLLVERPEHVHANTYGTSGARALRLILDEPFARLLDLPAQATPGHTLAGRIAATLAYDLTGGRADALDIEGASLEILGYAMNGPDWAPRSRPGMLGAFRRYVRAHLDEATSIEHLARVVGVPATRLARSFHRHYGLSLSGYVRNLRVHAAAEMLRDPRARLSEVATATGFSDQSHMGRSFMRAFGRTPAQLRMATR